MNPPLMVLVDSMNLSVTGVNQHDACHQVDGMTYSTKRYKKCGQVLQNDTEARKSSSHRYARLGTQRCLLVCHLFLRSSSGWASRTRSTRQTSSMSTAGSRVQRVDEDCGPPHRDLAAGIRQILESEVSSTSDPALDSPQDWSAGYLPNSTFFMAIHFFEQWQTVNS